MPLAALVIVAVAVPTTPARFKLVRSTATAPTRSPASLSVIGGGLPLTGVTLTSANFMIVGNGIIRMN